MTRIAIYPSILYGFDWIAESIASIRPFVGAVYLVLMKRPWGGTTGVRYKGEWIPWPERFDDTRERVEAMDDPSIHVLEDDAFSPWNRWGHALDVIGVQDLGEEVVFLDPDCVFHGVQTRAMFAEWDAHPEWQWAQPQQVELWRTPAWQVIRPRSMVSLHRGDLSMISDEVRKHRGVQPPPMHQLAATVHNLGFCCSERTTLWKHLAAMAFSPVIKESIPNPDWYEEKWLHWTPETRNLEVSLGCEGAIPCAVPYDGELPGAVRRRFGP